MNKSRMTEELKEWLRINIADDIVRTSNRPEYKEYIEKCKKFEIEEQYIPAVVLGMLLSESENIPFFKRLLRRVK